MSSILGYRQLKQLVTYGYVTNTKHKHIQPASIDLTLNGLWYDVITGQTFSADYLDLYPPSDAYESFYRLAKHFQLPIQHRPSLIIGETQQKFHIPYDVAGDVKLKSTPSRHGFDVSMGGWVDPGYCGTLSIVIRTYRRAVLRKHEPFVQIVFHRLDEITVPYTGKYQNSEGPRAAIYYG